MNNTFPSVSTIISAINGALIADAYALGAHWIYDEAQLKNLPIDWDNLNPPQAIWHKGKTKGDLTHYGDHTQWLIDYIQQHTCFDPAGYAAFWMEKMQDYQGYIDGSSRETLAILSKEPHSLEGSPSHDLSIIGRVAPLLLVAKTKEEFLALCKEFVSLTHNTSIVHHATEFFTNVLFDVALGDEIADVIERTSVSDDLAHAYTLAMASKGQESFSTIRSFGPACGVKGGFEGVIHILLSYDDYKSAMIANAKAGGDNAARGMIVGMIMGAAKKMIPQEWKNSVKNL